MTGTSIVGVGMTAFGAHDRPLTELFAEAAFPALDDAGVGAGDIDAFSLGNAMGGETENDSHLAPKIASHIGISGVPCQRFEDACATSSNAFKHAVRAVGSGEHDVALVGGAEK